MLKHAQAAWELMVARRAEEKRRVAEAEALLERYLTCSTDEPGVAEQMVEAAALLGWEPDVLKFEGGFAEKLEKVTGELDTLECHYRDALAKQKQREAHYRKHGFAEAGGEKKAAAELDLLGYQAEVAASSHAALRLNLFKWMNASRYPRPIPQRYRLELDRLVASALPPAELPISERNKPVMMRIPERPDLGVLTEAGDEAGNAARAKVFQAANDQWEAAAKICNDHNFAKMQEHEAWVEQEKARLRNPKPTANANATPRPVTEHAES